MAELDDNAAEPSTATSDETEPDAPMQDEGSATDGSATDGSATDGSATDGGENDGGENDGGENDAAKSSGDAAKPARKRSWLKRGLAVTLGLLVGLACAEAIFWQKDAGAFPHLNVYEADAELGVRLSPGAQQRTQVIPNPPSEVRINAAGLRHDMLRTKADSNVVVVGDSQVFGLGVEQSECFASQLEGELPGRQVVNAGVPTYGPLEYNKMAERWLAESGGKTLIYVINMANDLFEAARPNLERHKVWDGWAVRAPTAPLSVTKFPGRHWLYRHSHAFFHLRRLLYQARHPQLQDAAFDTDGSWRDLVAEAERAVLARQEQRQQAVNAAASYETEVTYARRHFELAEKGMVKLLYDKFTANDGDKAVLIGLARATPGDIVAPAPWEEAPPQRASILQIRKGAEFRMQLEAKLRELAKQDAAVRDTVKARDAAYTEWQQTQAAAVKVARRASPLAQRIAEAKAIADKAGAELLVAVLPIDVEVSESEWAKYNVSPIDVSSLAVLREDIIGLATDSGAKALDLTAALKAAEPGAFLLKDLHLTPKGHAAVAKAIAAALTAPPPPRYDSALPKGRSWLPTNNEFDAQKELSVSGSSAAGCETKMVREWLRLRCKQKGVIGPVPVGARVIRGGHGDAVVSTLDKVLTVIVPVLAGDTLEVELSWFKESRTLLIEWPEKEMPIWRDGKHISAATAGAHEPTVDLAAEALCACHKQLTSSEDCRAVGAHPSAACIKSYDKDCKAIMACSTGHPLWMPACESNEVNVGALRRCRARCEDKPCSSGQCVAQHGVKVCLP